MGGWGGGGEEHKLELEMESDGGLGWGAVWQVNQNTSKDKVSSLI